MASSSVALFEELLKCRGLSGREAKEAFFHPDYDHMRHDPWLLPDMDKAVERLERALADKEKVVIYGDYDIDGLTATTILHQAFEAFGISVEAFIPNRFVDGYGLSKAAIKELAKQYSLLVTVDCGSLSHSEIALAKKLGMDVIVTDHHSVADEMPAAIATINPKRVDHQYPFKDLAGVGVAFKLIQALQQKMEGLPPGQEKWFLDLVAFGTVCDVVRLEDENRANVFWGLQVFRKTRRLGLRKLIDVTGLEISELSARHLGFVLGPHLNAAGRLKTAQLSLDLLLATDPIEAQKVAEKLHEMNIERRAEQQRIYEQALIQADLYRDDPVLVLSGPDWSHGIIGIVAAKILEHEHKPTFVLQEIGELSKGSARSFGDFNAVEGIKAVYSVLEKGGGHALAAGVTLKTENIPAFRQTLNDYYKSLSLSDQEIHLKPKADLNLTSFDGLDMELLTLFQILEPFGNANPEPIITISNVVVRSLRYLGSAGKHLKLLLADSSGRTLNTIFFSYSGEKIEEGEKVRVTIRLMLNEWMGRRTIEGNAIEIIRL
jgi:single-stranded-DNA-specific exonuclease